MRLFDLFMLIFIMWIMIMIVSYFLIFIIGPLHIDIFHNSSDRLITSIIKASSAIALVVVLILLLGIIKTKYLQKILLRK
jgi:glucan phosphoethanolaminetransferase (alkaline phosphatase superfamily)